jgi:N-acetylglutamate synthase-like GNAT family acetyltransferase
VEVDSRITLNRHPLLAIEMEIREYQSSDQSACLNIMRSNIPEYFHECDLADFAVFLENLPGPFFVIIDPEEGLIACGGIALGRTSPTEAVLCYGMVAETRLHQGIGLELLRKRLDFFLPSAHQIERIVVNTTQKPEGFFRKFGFSVVERELDGFGSGLDRVSMMATKNDVIRLLNERLVA